jgi:hypothetical protein
MTVDDIQSLALIENLLVKHATPVFNRFSIEPSRLVQQNRRASGMRKTRTINRHTPFTMKHRKVLSITRNGVFLDASQMHQIPATSAHVTFGIQKANVLLA